MTEMSDKMRETIKQAVKQVREKYNAMTPEELRAHFGIPIGGNSSLRWLLAEDNLSPFADPLTPQELAMAESFQRARKRMDADVQTELEILKPCPVCQSPAMRAAESGEWFYTCSGQNGHCRVPQFTTPDGWNIYASLPSVCVACDGTTARYCKDCPRYERTALLEAAMETIHSAHIALPLEALKQVIDHEYHKLLPTNPVVHCHVCERTPCNTLCKGCGTWKPRPVDHEKENEAAFAWSVAQHGKEPS